MVLDRAAKRREEDPYTDRLLGVGDIEVCVDASRFEVDLNRERDAAVYRVPDDAWGLEVWDGVPDDEIVAGSLARYDEFYDALAELFDELAVDGPFVVYDLHSYNHRRAGPDADAEPAVENPDVNVGTSSLDRERFEPVVDAFIAAFSAAEVDGAMPDVRENVRFRGGELGRWAHARYPGRVCVLSIEFKKTFMDEWTDSLDDDHLGDLDRALRSTAAPVRAALARISRPPTEAR